jgi:hypothetical protein
LGDTIAQSTIWDGCAVAEIYPTSRIYHFDHQEHKIPELRTLYGDKLFFRVDGDGNIFEMALLDPEMDADAFEKQHNMQTYRAYHAQSTADNDEMLEKYPVVEE